MERESTKLKKLEYLYLVVYKVSLLSVFENFFWKSILISFRSLKTTYLGFNNDSLSQRVCNDSIPEVKNDSLLEV